MLALVMPMPLMVAVVAMVISLFMGTFPSFGCIRVFDNLVQFPAIEPDPATRRAVRQSAALFFQFCPEKYDQALFGKFLARNTFFELG
jgi:hypothetical protein